MKKQPLIILLFTVSVLLFLIAIYKTQQVNNIDAPVSVKESQFMDLTVYQTNPEGELEAIIIQIPKTERVANASLEYLFDNNLSAYGEYGGVRIIDNTAYIKLLDNPLSERTFSSLSSAEILDLKRTVHKTLIQYPSINNVIFINNKGEEIIF